MAANMDGAIIPHAFHPKWCLKFELCNDDSNQLSQLGTKTRTAACTGRVKTKKRQMRLRISIQ